MRLTQAHCWRTWRVRGSGKFLSCAWARCIAAVDRLVLVVSKQQLLYNNTELHLECHHYQSRQLGRAQRTLGRVALAQVRGMHDDYN